MGGIAESRYVFFALPPSDRGYVEIYHTRDRRSWYVSGSAWRRDGLNGLYCTLPEAVLRAVATGRRLWAVDVAKFATSSPGSVAGAYLGRGEVPSECLKPAEDLA